MDLLPFRIEDARRELEHHGDFTFEALSALRKAEDERRGLLTECREIRLQLIASEGDSQVEDITTDSGKGSCSFHVNRQSSNHKKSI